MLSTYGMLSCAWWSCWFFFILCGRKQVNNPWPLVLFVSMIQGVIIIVALIQWFSIRSRKSLLSLKVLHNQLVFEDDSHNQYTKSLSQIKTYKLKKCEGILKFDDNIKIVDLEKLYHWPLLREYLLSKLESQ